MEFVNQEIVNWNNNPENLSKILPISILNDAKDALKIFRRENCLLHTTSQDAFRKIVESDAILPNDGSFGHKYPQSNHSIAKISGAISLFDLYSETETNVLDMEGLKWFHFFIDHSPTTIILEIDRTKLDPNKLFNASKVAWDYFKSSERKLLPTAIPYVEVCHSGLIPLNCVTKYYAVGKSSRMCSLIT